MKKVFSRFVALILTLSISLSALVLPASASYDELVDMQSVNLWQGVTSVVSSVVGGVFDVIDTLFPPSAWINFGYNSPEELKACVGALNQLAPYGGLLANSEHYRHLTDLGLVNSFIMALYGGQPMYKITFDDNYQVYRIVELSSHRYVVNKNGHFPFSTKSEYEAYTQSVAVGGEVPATEIRVDEKSPERFYSWSNMKEYGINVVPYSTLSTAYMKLQDMNVNCQMFRVHFSDTYYRVIHKDNKYFGDLSGRIFVALEDDGKAAVNNTVMGDYVAGDKVIIEDNTQIDQTIDIDLSTNPDYSTLIDIDKMMFNPNVFEEGSNPQFIDSLTYNPDNSTYTVNTYDYTYNTTNNYYEFNYYTYNVQYTYNNTYVNYIGSTAEFQPTEYKLYYELPDGRSSADLTEEDIAGLSFQFADVVNYKRGVTDESLLALYHFDGDTEDDSYYSYPLPRNNTNWKALPEGYTQLEYIESTGTQYIKIDEAFVHCQGRFDLDFQFSDDRPWYSAFGTNTSSNGQWEFDLYRVSDGVGSIANDSHSSVFVPYSGGRCHFIFDFSKGTYSIAGNTGSLVGSRPGSGWLAGSPFYLFANSRSYNRVCGRFYGLTTSSPFNTIHSCLVPCISPSGEIGVYNNAYYLRVGSYPANPDHYFYGNSGSGEFIAGPAVKSQIQPSGKGYSRFLWTKGASITYMESNAFNGALYLDETEHEFKINLPKTLGRDFSVYFRYYQNSGKDTNHIDNYISSNGNKLLSWSEQYMYAPDGHELTTPLSVGSWQEIALFRRGSQLYIYHNGIKVETVFCNAALSDSLIFHLGSSSRAYSMVDEIRILDFPRTTWGSYTPTVVPMDTNQVLVLPNTKVQVSGLDTYYDYRITDSTNLYSLFTGVDWEQGNYAVSTDSSGNYDGGTAFHFNNYVCYDEEDGDYAWGRPERFDRSHVYDANSGPGHGPFDDYTFTYEPIIVTAGDSEQGIGSSADGVVSMSSVTPSVILTADGDFYLSDCSAAPMYLWGVKMKYGSKDWAYLGCYYDNIVSSYFNVVFDDYSIARVPVTWGGSDSPVRSYTATSSTGKTAHIQFVTKGSNYWSVYDGAYLQYYTVYDSDPIRMFWLGDQSAVDVQIIHDYYNTPTSTVAANTAALQTDIPIRSYIVGGVRPILPELGDVWMMVEGRRITSVQIYNGRAWEEIAARWWTGSRWIPIYAFDIVTLADMWDVTGQDGETVAPTITTQSGFWNWWKNQWLDFRRWLNGIVTSVTTEWKDFRQWLESVLGTGEKPSGPVTYVPKVYTLDFADEPEFDLEVNPFPKDFLCGTEDYFTANGSRIRHEGYYPFSDGFRGNSYYGFGGETGNNLSGRSIKFTTSVAGATVKLWWMGKGDPGKRSFVVVRDSSSTIIGSGGDPDFREDYYGSRFVDTFSLYAPGTYYITAQVGDCNLFKVEVTDGETEAEQPSTEPIANVYMVNFIEETEINSSGSSPQGLACGTEDYFSVSGKYIRHNSDPAAWETFSDGFRGYGYFTFGGATKTNLSGRSIKFTTKSVGATVTVWWATNGDGRYVGLCNSTGTVIGSAVIGSAAKKKVAYMDTFTLGGLEDYYITAQTGDCYVYKVVVADGVKAPDYHPGGGVRDDSIDEIYHTIEDDDGERWNVFDLFVQLVKGGWKVVKGTVKTVVGGFSGLVSGIASVGDYFDEYDRSLFDVFNVDSVFGVADYGGWNVWD